MRKLMAVSLATLVGGFSLSTVAFGQGAGGDQYTPGTGVETTTTATTPEATPTPTATPAPVAGAGDPSVPPSTAPEPGVQPDEDTADVGGENAGGGETDDGSSTTPKKASPGTAGGQGAPALGAAAGFPGNRVAVLQFGLASDELENDIDEALRRAGLQTMFLGEATKAALTAFLASAEAKALTDAGPRALGKAFGAQLVNVTDASRAAFPVLFGSDTPFVPVIRAVLTRRAGISADAVQFHRGVAEGLKSAGIPVAYVETTDTKPSFADDYKSIKVPAVDDVDTDSGKQRLGQIMLGDGTTSDEVDPDSASALGAPADADSGVSVVSAALLLALGAGAVLWFTTAGRRLRARTASDK